MKLEAVQIPESHTPLLAPSPRMRRAIQCWALSCTLLLTVGCATDKRYVINLMPAPDVYDSGDINPFIDTDETVSRPNQNILYATDRRPAGERAREKYYLNERGSLLRLGEARIELGKTDMTWEEAKRISLLKNRPGNYPLVVAEVEEFGVLNRTLTMFDHPDITPDDPEPAREYAAAINQKLAESRTKDIFIYVHGYKVIFENPLLVASELWHFLGYDGVFIAYSWPATPKRTAYFADLETARYAARNFRIFLQYLAEETDARRGRLAALPGEYRLGETVLKHGGDHALEHVVGHEVAALAGIQLVGVQVEAVRAPQVAARADGLDEQLERSG